MGLFRDIGLILGSFLVGGVPFCYILGKIVSGKKLTEIGDKNPGGWNLVFNVSKIWGFIGILLDMAKGYFAYFIAYRLVPADFIQILNSPYNQIIAVLAGCAAVAGHNYSPYMKFKGGKGIATWGGLAIAGHQINLPIGAAGLLIGLLVAKNMIWSVSLGVIFTGLFLFFLKGSIIYIIMIFILLALMIPKQINRNISLGLNFKFRKEKSLQDLFKPKIR